jgi:protein-tyrosine phosphatase
MGIGRSSIIAAAVLLKYKQNADKIIENISTIRGLKVPDTDKQLSWLKSRKV